MSCRVRVIWSTGHVDTRRAMREMHTIAIRFVMLLLCCPPALTLSASASGGRHWDVVLRRGSERHVVTVDETTPVLKAVEEAGLLPQSNCRRGNCLACAAQVVAGKPYTLQVSDDTALCSEAHAEGLVLLCSAYASGPGIELELDQEWRALDIQYSGRFAPRNRGASPEYAAHAVAPSTQWMNRLSYLTCLNSLVSQSSRRKRRECDQPHPPGSAIHTSRCQNSRSTSKSSCSRRGWTVSSVKTRKDEDTIPATR